MQSEKELMLEPEKDSQTDLEGLKKKKNNLEANLKFYGKVENTQAMGDEFYSYFDESMREIGEWSFGRRLVQIALLLATFIGILSAVFALAIRHMSLAILIIPIAASFAVLNSLIELTSDIYNYFKIPKEERTELHKYKLATAPVSTLLVGGILTASAMIGLAVPGGFIALALAFSAYMIFKLCQGCIGQSMREQGRSDAEMELVHVNKAIAKLEKQEENRKDASLASSPSATSLYELARSELSTAHTVTENSSDNRNCFFQNEDDTSIHKGNLSSKAFSRS